MFKYSSYDCQFLKFNLTNYFNFHSVPGIAEQDDFLSVNSTSATMFLESWPSGLCPVLYFNAAYRAQGELKWQTIGTNINPHEEVTITNLKPATRYYIRIMANNDAGFTKHEYVFATRSKNGGK